jgi:hypothetical protein
MVLTNKHHCYRYLIKNKFLSNLIWKIILELILKNLLLIYKIPQEKWKLSEKMYKIR